MLQTIRDNSKGTIAKVIVFFIAMTFSLFGIETVVSLVNQPDAPVEVNGAAISQLDIERAVDIKKQQLKSQFGDQINFLLENDQMLRQGAVEELINRKVLAAFASDAGQYVSNRHVAELVTQDPSFQSENTFNQNQYVAVLRNAGYTPTEYQKYIKEQINIQNLQFAIGQSEFVTPVEREKVSSLERQVRDFRYTTLKIADFSDQVTVTDDEIAHQYTLNADRYMTQEQVSVDYILLSKDMLQDAVDVEEADIKTLYDHFVADLLASEQRQVAHILVTAEKRDDEAYRARVQQVQQALSEPNADFVQLAKAYSDDSGSALNGGDLGFNGRGILPKAFEEAMYALSKGEVSDAVVTDSGTHFIKLLDIRSKPIPSYESKKEALLAEAKGQKIDVLFAERKAEISEKAFEYETLHSLAEDVGLTMESTALFSRAGGLGIAQHPDVVKAAFSEVVLANRQISEPIDLGDQLVVLGLKQHNPSVQKPLDDVKSGIESELRAEKAKAAVLDRGREIVKGLSTGERFDFEWKKAESVSRKDQQSVNPAIVNKAFQIQKQDLPQYDAFSLPLGDVVLIALESVSEGPVGDIPEEDQMKLEYAQIQATYAAFQQQIRSLSEVKINIDLTLDQNQDS